MGKLYLLLAMTFLLAMGANAQSYNISLVDSTAQCLGECNATIRVCTVGAPQNVVFVYDSVERREVRTSYLDVTNNSVQYNVTGLSGSLSQDGVPLPNLTSPAVVLAGQCDDFVVDLDKNSTLFDIDAVPYVGSNRHDEFTWMNSSWSRRIRMDNLSTIVGDDTTSRFLVGDIGDLSCASDYSDLRVTWENTTYVEDRNFTWWSFGTSLLVYFSTSNVTGGNHYLYCDNDETVSDLKNPEGVSVLYDTCGTDGSLNASLWNTTGTSSSGVTTACETGSMHLKLVKTNSAGSGVPITGDVKVSGNITTVGSLSSTIMMINYSTYTVTTGISGTCTVSTSNNQGISTTSRTLKDYITKTKSYDPFSCLPLTAESFNIVGPSTTSSLATSGTGFREITTDSSTSNFYVSTAFTYTATASTGDRMPYFSQSVSVGKTAGSGTNSATTDLLVSEVLFAEWSGTEFNESVDIDSPEVSFTDPLADSCNPGNVIDFEYSITEDVNIDTIYYIVNNASAVIVDTGGGDQTGTFSFSISFGTHTITLFANDTSGNVGNDTISLHNQASCGEGGGGSAGGGGGGGTSNSGETILISPEGFDVKPLIVDKQAFFYNAPRIATQEIKANRPISTCQVLKGNTHTMCSVTDTNTVTVTTQQLQDDFFQQALESEILILSPANEAKNVNVRFNFVNLGYYVSFPFGFKFDPLFKTNTDGSTQGIRIIPLLALALILIGVTRLKK